MTQLTTLDSGSDCSHYQDHGSRVPRDYYNPLPRNSSTQQEALPGGSPSIVTRRRMCIGIARSNASIKRHSAKRERMMRLARTYSEFLRSAACCVHKQCFQVVGHIYLKAQATKILGMDEFERKVMLVSFHENGKFYFNRVEVCSSVLTKAFRFSKTFQVSVKGTAHALATPLPVRLPRHGCTSMTKDFVLNFLDRMADISGDYMPDATSTHQEVHLPFFQKSHVYDCFKGEFSERGANGVALQIPSASYFLAVWKKHRPHIKARRVKRFSKCSDCEFFRKNCVMWEVIRSRPGLSLTQGLNTWIS